MTITKEDILNIQSLITGTRVQEITVTTPSGKLTLKQKDKAPTVTSKSTPSSPSSAMPAKVETGVFIKSKNVGYFSFKGKTIKKAEIVKEDTIIGIINTLGAEHEVVADKTGKVLEVLITEGGIVEYGQPLLKIE